MYYDEHSFRNLQIKVGLICVLAIIACLVFVGTASAATYSSGKIYPTDDTFFQKNQTATNYTMGEIGIGDATMVRDYTAGALGVGLYSNTVSNQYYRNNFWAGSFLNKAGLLPNDTITSAAVCIYSHTTGETTGLGSLNFALVPTSFSDPTNIAVGDYPHYNNASRLATDKTPAGWTNSVYNCYNFTSPNTTVNKTGYTNVLAGLANVLDNSTSGISWAANDNSAFNMHSAAYTGTTRDPYIEYTWDTYVAPGNPTFADFTVSRINAGYSGNVAFTDTSNNTPTSWLWEFGDGNTSTSQNPTHRYDVQGTHTVNHWANNTDGGSWDNGTVITIDNWADYYINPYFNMTPWYDQGSTPLCSGMAGASVINLLRFESLGVSPGTVQEPYARDAAYYVSGGTRYSDAQPDYSPSPGGIYHDVYDIDSSIVITDIGDVLMGGVNLASDEITPKSGTTEYFYPQSSTYLNSHKRDPISGYAYHDGNTTENWKLLQETIYRNHTALMLIGTYSNLHSTPSDIMLPEPNGDYVIGHYVAAVGYDRELNRTYFVNSWGDDYTKLGGISFNYWNVSWKSKFIAPYGITVNEYLKPLGVSNIANATPGSSYFNVSWENPAHTDFSNTLWRVDNVQVLSATNVTTYYNFTGLSSSTEYLISAQTCDFYGCNATFENVTIITASDTEPTPTPTPTPTTPPTTVPTTVPTINGTTTLTATPTPGQASSPNRRVVINPSVENQPFFCKFSITKWIPFLCPQQQTQQQQIAPEVAAWKPWAPAYTFVGNAPNGTTTIARYSKIGNVVSINLRFNATDSMGSSLVYISLPINASQESAFTSMEQYWNVTQSTTDPGAAVHMWAPNQISLDFATNGIAGQPFQYFITGSYESV